MNNDDPGPVTREQLSRLGRVWRQGEHVLITGPTGSGKTALARSVVEERIKRNGFVAVFIGKLGADRTIQRDYAGWSRWHDWHKRPRVGERRVLLWPNTDKYKTLPDKRKLQREVFTDAMDKLSNSGLWTVQIDEGLYTVSPTFLNLGDHLALLHQQGRSSDLTLVTLAQRPSHLPLIIYSSASHVFAGQMNVASDLKRLSELGGKESAKVYADRISALDRHEFLWIPVAPNWSSEIVDLRK